MTYILKSIAAEANYSIILLLNIQINTVRARPLDGKRARLYGFYLS